MPPQEMRYPDLEKPSVSIELIVFIEKNLFEMEFLCDNARFIIILRDPYTGKEVLLPKVFPISALEEKLSLGIVKSMFAGQEELLEDLYYHARKQLAPGEILTLEQDDLPQWNLITAAIH